MSNKRIGIVVVSAILAATCTNSESVPSSPSLPSGPEPPATADVWNVRAHFTELTGGGCVGDAMRSSQMEVSNSYTLSITPSGNGATIDFKDVAGHHVCRFTGAASDSNGFTTVGRSGHVSCLAGGEVVAECPDGQHVMMAFGADISGHISGDHISGEWTFSWESFDVYPALESLHTTTEFTGSR